MKRRFGIVCALLLAALTLGCAEDMRRSRAAEIRVERLTEIGKFRVQWSLPESARALIFLRGGTERETRWRSLTPGAVFTRKAGFDVLESRRPIRSFEVEIDEQLVEAPGEYPLMVPFSDKGVVLFTDHLMVSWMNCLVECAEDDARLRTTSPPAIRTMLNAAPGEWVVVNGRTSRSRIGLDANTQGAVAYFGPHAPIRAPGFTFIADHGLPNWTLEEVQQVFPRLIDLYTRRLGIPLQSSPTVFIPYLTGQRRFHASFSGSVLSSEVVIGLFGDKWKTPSPETRHDLLRLLAHESFHLWNASRFRGVASAGGEWLHEGSADAFASLAMFELGAIGRKEFVESHTEALNRCALGLSGTSLTAAVLPWTARNPYDCGAIMQLLLHRALRDQGSDLWKFWRALFDRAAGTSGYYTHADFFKLAAEGLRGSAGALVDRLRELGNGLMTGASDSAYGLENFLIGMYEAAGVGLAVFDRDWPEWYSRGVIERAFQMALELDCGPDLGYWISEESGARLIGGPKCRSIRNELRIEAVGGHRLWTDGVRVYDHMQQTCLSEASLSVTGANGDRRELLCPKLPPRPRYLIPRTAERL